MQRGWLITFEGGEGCGKTTQIERLREHLEARGFAVVVSREPGGTPLGEGVRRLLLDPGYDPDALTELFLLEASRRDHVQRFIRPALERGAVVLCDRFTDSSLVYQGMVGGVAGEVVEKLNALATGGLAPDRTLVLDLAPGEGLGRARDRNRNGGGVSRIDEKPLPFHDRVRRGFLELARRDPERVRVVDAAGPAAEVFARVLAELPEALR